MRLRVSFVAALVFAGILAAGAARAQTLPPQAALFQPVAARPVTAFLSPPSLLGPGQQCRAAIRAAERAAGIPRQLMAAIGRVESGRREPDGRINPWPWSINAEGVDHVFETKAEAIAAVRALQAQGVRSIDVGCMQVNLLHHPDAFPTLEQAFDPVANAAYAARFLLQLHQETGPWPTATAWYNSATPELGADYQRRVAAVWPEEQQQPDIAAPPPPGFASTYASGYASGFSGGYTNGFSNGYVAPNGVARPGGIVATVRAPAPHMIPLQGAGSGRSLAAYRAAPIAVMAPAPPSPPAPMRTASQRG